MSVVISARLCATGPTSIQRRKHTTEDISSSAACGPVPPPFFSQKMCRRHGMLPYGFQELMARVAAGRGR